MCDAFSFLEHEASSAHSCLCPRLPWAVQPDIGSLYSTFLGRHIKTRDEGVGRGDKGRSQRAGPQRPWGGRERVEPRFGKKGSALCASPNPLLLAPLGPSAHLRWRLYSQGCLFCYWEDAGVNPGLAVYQPESLPKLPGGPQRGLAALHSGSIWKCTRAISTVTRTNRRHCLSQARAAGGALSGRDSASQSRDFHASPAQLSSTHS